MPVDLQPEVLEADLTQIVEDIFQTMLSMEIQKGDLRIERLRPPVVTASMHLSGHWSGAVLLQCELAAATEFTSAMLGIAAPTSADEDVKDAMGELINMVAGNFKSLLGGMQLSLPTVVEGQDYRFRILRGQQTAQICFQTLAGPFFLTLFELEAPPAS